MLLKGEGEGFADIRALLSSLILVFELFQRDVLHMNLCQVTNMIACSGSHGKQDLFELTTALIADHIDHDRIGHLLDWIVVVSRTWSSCKVQYVASHKTLE